VPTRHVVVAPWDRTDVRHRVRSARLKTLIAHRVPLALRPGLLATP